MGRSRTPASVLKAARLACGYSRAQVETALGLPVRSLERWEARGQRPPENVLRRLAAYLGLSTADVGLSEGDVPLAEALDGLVARHGAETVLEQAVRAAFRRA